MAVKRSPCSSLWIADSIESLSGSPSSPRLNHALRVRRKRVELPSGWYCDERSQLLIFGDVGASAASQKVASFDFDKTLVMETGRERVNADPLRITPRFSNTFEKLRSLHAEGYKIVVFTNESIYGKKTVKTVTEHLQRKMQRLQRFIELCGVTATVLVAIRGTKYLPSPYRKPNPGMWRYHAARCNAGVPVDPNSSFYVGDAAGRPTDFSNCDARFARKAGVPFFTETEYFSDGSDTDSDSVASF